MVFAIACTAIGQPSPYCPPAMGPPSPHRVYLGCQLDAPARLLTADKLPSYPGLMDSAGIGGRVVVAFYVDTTGHAEPASIGIMKAPHRQFENAVRTAITRWRFTRPRLNGVKVRERLEATIEFIASDRKTAPCDSPAMTDSSILLCVHPPDRKPPPASRR